MKFPFHPWRRLLLCALPFAALLTACDDGKKEPPPKPAEVTTYNSVPWDALPATSDADLLAGFNAWRSACARLSEDPVWGEPCASATTVAADPTAVRAFLQERMQVYSLRSSSNGDQGLITGYYEPVYHGSLSQGEKTPVPVYGVPDDLVVVALESVYPELKAQRLRGRLEGRVLKPYDDAATIRDNGSSAPVLAWLGDPMDLQFLQIQGSGRIQLEDGRQLRIGYGDQNGHPYKPVGRWLVEQGLRAEGRDQHEAHPRLGRGQSAAGLRTAGEQSQLRVLQPAPGQRRRSARLAERTADRRLQRGHRPQGDSAGQPDVAVHHPP